MSEPRSTKNLFKALSEFQKECPNIPKNAKNPHFQSNYADHAGTRTHVQELLAKHGLTVNHTVTGEYDQPRLETILKHVESDEFIVSYTPLLMQQKTMQALGSSLTYAQRYATIYILGIAAEEEDDDANTANGLPKKPATENKKADIPNRAPQKGKPQPANVTPSAQATSPKTTTGAKDGRPPLEKNPAGKTPEPQSTGTENISKAQYKHIVDTCARMGWTGSEFGRLSNALFGKALAQLNNTEYKEALDFILKNGPPSKDETVMHTLQDIEMGLINGKTSSEALREVLK